MQPIRRNSACAALMALSLAFPIVAQEPLAPQPGQNPGQDKAPPPIDVTLPPVSGESSSDEEIDARMEQLIRDVERQLRNIDRLLEDAAAGGSGAGEAAREAGAAAKSMSELMKRSRSESEAAVKSIDEILELASIPKQSQSDSSSGSCSSLRKSIGKGSKPSSSHATAQGQPGSDQKSPLEGARDATTQREKTGNGREAGPQPKPGQQQLAQGQPKPGGQPNDNRASDQPATQQEGAPPPGAEKGAVANNANTTETWGFLPEHARDVFRSQGGGEYPARYRDWIDSYYKKLNQRP